MLNREKFAVIDTETNYEDEVISIGMVIAEAATYRIVDRLYLIVYPACNKPAMFSAELRHPRAKIDAVAVREDAIAMMRDMLARHGVGALFAYNAKFDCRHLPELGEFHWYDIMRLAAYRQYNPGIPEDAPCCKTGRLKSGYGVEQVYAMLAPRSRYSEVHNALTDAEDELRIMQMMGHEISLYEVGRV